ncbi:MAG TPA: hypothetical protein DEP66_04755 [Acidimicrobiaceae bacterium]|nr:hypothetical protein [Acidimicrobiaceae bacterium]
MTHRDEALGAAAHRQLGRGQQVVHAGDDVVGPPVADPDRADALGTQRRRQAVVQPARRPEHAAQRAAAHQHDVLGVGRAVPEEGEQPLGRVGLDVAQVVAQPHLDGRQRVQPVERALRRR